VIVLDERMRRALARHGGAAIRRPLLKLRPIADHPMIHGGAGVYVACDLHDRVLYVGSVYRPTNPFGVSCRIAEHLAEPDQTKALRWQRLWALLVDEPRDLGWIRDYEAVVGAELAPVWNERLPAL